MKTSKFYTEYEDSVILDWVKNYPHNLGLAFNGAARQLPGRTLEGIRHHWYHALKGKQSGFVLKSDSMEIANRKNISEKKELHGAE